MRVSIFVWILLMTAFFWVLHIAGSYDYTFTSRNFSKTAGLGIVLAVLVPLFVICISALGRFLITCFRPSIWRKLDTPTIVLAKVLAGMSVLIFGEFLLTGWEKGPGPFSLLAIFVIPGLVFLAIRATEDVQKYNSLHGDQEWVWKETYDL